MRALCVVLVCACGGASPPPARTVETIAPDRCAAVMQERFAIDTSPEQRVCVPLFEAIVSLGPQGQEVARGLTIVRDRRGRCGDLCLDLASALMSDAMLASYRTSKHELHVTDATFEGPRWKGSKPSVETVAVYLGGLGLDWMGLVDRVRALPGAALPAGPLEVGDERVLDTIVRLGPRILMHGEVTLADLFRHELGHALQLHAQIMFQISGWSRLTGWTESRNGELADGFIGGGYEGEQPIVASRLILGLPRGASSYRPAASGPPTGYAQFDPMEDFGESVRLAHADPAALARISPVRLLAAGTADTLRDPVVRAAIVPGVRALLASDEGIYAMMVLRRLGPAILPEAASLADVRPLPWPADATAEERADFAKAELVVTIGAHTFRPTDAAFLEMLRRYRADAKELDEFNRGLPKLEP